ncbi:PriCT-2 domain-containing protein [Lutibacter maritimus]|uniref:Uncharacterized protein n=1 Tax=Lutibacter maritimus TaxID=593133 RepID=A0A1I6REW8_9FLAO|nr:PriCT-2 domain-containing protein [Lutibacter maritimus]SFS63028.1 hypothetical protein SAMN04488006_2386 [Lutibacter maritimus]
METINKRVSIYQQLISRNYENEFTIDYLVEMDLGFKWPDKLELKKKKSISNNFRDVVREIEKYSMDLAPDYNHRVVIGLAMAFQYGKKARNLYHRICKINENYDKELCNKEFSKCLQNNTSFFSIDIVHTLFSATYFEAMRSFNMKRLNKANSQKNDNIQTTINN